MEIRQYAKLFWRWWWLILGAALISAVAGYYFTRMQPPVYRASTSLMVNPQSSTGVTYEDVITGQSLTKTYAELIRKTPLLVATANKLGLPYDPEQLRKRVLVQAVPNTMILVVSVDNSNPALARDIANALAESFIAQQTADAIGQQSASRDILQQQISDLGQQVKSLSQAIEAGRSSRNSDSAELDRLQSNLSQAQLTYSQLVKNDLDMRLAESRAYSVAKVVEPASVPGSPISPSVPQNTLFAALIGLVLAVGAVYVIEYLDDTIKTGDDVQRLVDLSTLGVVGRIPATKAEEKEPRLIGELGIRSSLAESFRILRVNLDFAWAGNPGKTVLLTSANPREGKTTTLANLAVVLAKDNRSVIMVDGDLRRPSLHRAFHLEATPGLTNLLAEPKARVADYVQPTKIPNLSVLSSGPIPPNPSELLGSARFRQILEELRQTVDIVLVDSPPLLAVADTPLMSTMVDGVILILEAGTTRAQALARSNEVLNRSAVRVLGVVLNKLSRRSADYYYHYYYRRYYGHDAASSNGAEKRREAASV